MTREMLDDTLVVRTNSGDTAVVDAIRIDIRNNLTAIFANGCRIGHLFIIGIVIPHGKFA